MLSIFKKTEYVEFNKYKRMIDRLDDIYFMDYIAKRNM